METDSRMIKGWSEVAIYFILLLTFILLAIITVVTGFDSIYAQLFVIPVTLAGMWNGRKGIILAVVYGLLGITLGWLAEGHISIPGAVQAAVYLLVAVAIGIPSERKNRFMRLITESEEKFRDIASCAGDGVMAVNGEGKMIFASPAAAGIAGRASGDSAVKPDAPAGAIAVCMQAITENRPVRKDLVLTGEAGERRIFELHANPVTSTGGAVGTFQDVTECRKAQAALQESRDLSATLLESYPGLVWRSDRHGKVVYYNRSWQDFTGRRFEEGEPEDGWWQHIHEADRDRRQQVYSKAMEAGRDFICTYRLRRQDGSYRWMLESSRPYLGADGHFAGYISFMLDITGQKIAAEELLADNSRLSEIIEESPDAMLTLDASCNIGTFNRKACQLLKYTAGEVTGKHVSTILPPGSSIRIRPEQSYVRDFRRGDEAVVKLNIAAASLPANTANSGMIITLKDLSTVAGLKIIPLADNSQDTDQRYNFKRGVIYLIDKNKITYYMDLFADQVERAPRSLCISRQCEKVIREKYRLDQTPVIWLSNGESGDGMTVKPGNMTGLTAAVSEFIDGSGNNGTILLDGMEYLIARNGFDTMLKFIQHLNDKIMISNCSAMFCIDTNTLEGRQLHLLLSEMTEFREN